MKRASIKAAIFVASFAAAATAAAQAWPNRAVRLIVPWPPAGTTDIIVRPLAQKLTENLGQQFVVDNRGGANGLIGTEMTAKAPADGYTFLFTTLASFAQNTSYYRKLGYDPNSFVLLGQVGWTPIMMLAHPSLPVKNARDVIALAKARPGELVWDLSARGSSAHFAGALLALETKTNMVHVPCRGGGPVAAANIAGEVPIHYGGVPPTIQFVKSGRLKALAVTAAKRTAFLPGADHCGGAKIRDYDITVTFGMLAQAGAPRPIMDRMHAEIAKVLQSPDFKSRLSALGTDETAPMSSAELADWLKRDRSLARFRRSHWHPSRIAPDKSVPDRASQRDAFLHAHHGHPRDRRRPEIESAQRGLRFQRDDHIGRRRHHRRGNEGRPVIGYAFNSTGRYACGADAGALHSANSHGQSRLAAQRGEGQPRAGKILACMMQREKPGGHTERSIAIGTIESRYGTRSPKLPASRSTACWRNVTTGEGAGEGALLRRWQVVPSRERAFPNC